MPLFCRKYAAILQKINIFLPTKRPSFCAEKTLQNKILWRRSKLSRILGFPIHFVLRSAKNPLEKHFEFCREKSPYFGQNLPDFAALFEGILQTEKQRSQPVFRAPFTSYLAGAQKPL